MQKVAFWAVMVLVAVAYLRIEQAPITAARETSAAEALFSTPRNGAIVEVRGTVERLLSDDNDGSRHQRFIVRVDGSRTLLVAHNVDIAPRVSNLEIGDEVEVKGEYEWNDRGGLIHWTHRDPAGRHESGWVRHAGREYR
jgi:hypothetical protein